MDVGKEARRQHLADAGLEEYLNLAKTSKTFAAFIAKIGTRQFMDHNPVSPGTIERRYAGREGIEQFFFEWS